MKITKEQIRLNQEAAGIPESKPSIAPCAEETHANRMLRSHIAGVLVSDLGLPPEVLGALSWNSTDEGIAEHNARPGVAEVRVSIGKENFEKALEQRRDDVIRRDIPLYESRDPLKEVADRYKVAGMRPKFLSSTKVKDTGGTGDYEVVKNANGDPVKVKGMVLAHIPEEVAVARRRQSQERGNQLLKQIGEAYKRDGGPTAVADQ